ncbi:MAG: M1 family aminopeptidase [Candidatus Krumholzibacteriia bacterium]
MKRVIPLILCASLLWPVRVASQDYFQQFVHYTIKVRLDTQNHTLTGTESINYVNNSPDTLRQFYLHLYPNAYRSKESALIKDVRRGFNGTLFDLPNKHRSHLGVSEVTIGGQPVEVEVDDTIARMDLPVPLAPGQSMEVRLRFEEKIRRHVGRAGYKGKHYDLAQWYPKVVVYDQNGFHPDKFRVGEFYGEFGTFDVHIEVPANYVIAATGVVRAGDPGWSLNPPAGGRGAAGANDADPATKTVHFHAEDVHDFAWSADPDFVVQDTTVGDVEIRSFYRKHNKAWRDSTLAHGVRAIEWLSEKVGLYPYPQVSVVDALLRGGMEYPMLVMNGRVSEGLVLHEVGHIYFFGIFGNDEREEAWLDEGFTTFQTSWYMQDRYGPYGPTREWNWYDRLTPQFTERGRLHDRVFPLLRLGYGERVSTRAEDFEHDYYTMVYRKAALMFFALRYVVGEETMERILKKYFEEWKLKHVNEERFRKVCEEVSGQDLGWFFEEWLHTKKLCDYRLAEMKSSASERGDSYTTRVKIERLGEIIMPLAVEFTFADGSTQTVSVDGRPRTINKSYSFPEKAVRAAINPANEIADMSPWDNFVPRRRALSVDWPNNHYYREDAYQIRYRPAGWYNDIDGGKAGLHLSGSYANWFRRLKLGLYWGFKSERLDFSASYLKPVRILGANGGLGLSGYKMEGRNDFTFRMNLRKRKQLIHPPTKEFVFGVNYHELTNTRFVSNPETYEKGSEVAPFFGLSLDPQYDVMSTKFNVGVRFGREWFGGDFKYTALTASAVFKTRTSIVPFDGRLRLFAGSVSGSVPFQEKLSLAGGGPLAEERRFFLRSPGAIWDEANYHEPGHGNLRGYREGTFGVNKLVALNLEVGRSLPLLSGAADKLLGAVKAYAFLDMGATADSDNPILSSQRVQVLVDGGLLDEALVDAGIGFTFHRVFPFYDAFVRFDIPFYVNNPQLNGESKETEYRYVLSLTSTF